VILTSTPTARIGQAMRRYLQYGHTARAWEVDALDRPVLPRR
jgi:hypothetical protein